MTTPDERTNALNGAYTLLAELAQLDEPVDVTALRSEASRLLRHYPDPGLIYLIARGSTWLAAQDPDTGANTVLCELPPVETAQAFIDKFREQEEANRRAEVRSGKLLSRATLIARLGVTEAKLRKLVDRGSVFSLDVDGKDYYPEVFVKEKRRNRRRLFAINRILWPAPPTLRIHFLESQWGSLGALTPLQCLKNDGRYRRLRVTARGYALDFYRISLMAYSGQHELEPESAAADYDVAEDCDPRRPLWRRCSDAMSCHGYTGVRAPYRSLKDSTVFVNQLKSGSHPPERLARLNISIERNVAKVSVERYQSRKSELEVAVDGTGTTIEDTMREVFRALSNRQPK